MHLLLAGNIASECSFHTDLALSDHRKKVRTNKDVFIVPSKIQYDPILLAVKKISYCSWLGVPLKAIVLHWPLIQHKRDLASDCHSE